MKSPDTGRRHQGNLWYDPARRFPEQEKELAEVLTKGLKGEVRHGKCKQIGPGSG